MNAVRVIGAAGLAASLLMVCSSFAPVCVPIAGAVMTVANLYALVKGR